MTEYKREEFVTGFKRNLGDGIAAGMDLRKAIDATIADRQTVRLGYMLKDCVDKSDTQAEKVVRRTIGAVFVGAKVEKGAKGFFVVKIKDATVSNSAVDNLHKLTEGGYVSEKSDGSTVEHANPMSIRGQVWAKAFAPQKKGQDNLTEAELQAKEIQSLRAAISAFNKKAKSMTHMTDAQRRALMVDMEGVNALIEAEVEARLANK